MKLCKIFKSGGSMVVAIPEEFMKAMGVTRGDQVIFFLSKEGRVQLTKARMELFKTQTEELKLDGQT